MNLQKTINRAIILILPALYVVICAMVTGIIRLKTPTYIMPDWCYISIIVAYIWIIIGTIAIANSDIKNQK